MVVITASNWPPCPYQGKVCRTVQGRVYETHNGTYGRAPSYVSKNSAGDGMYNGDYDDDVSLIKHDRKSSKSGLSPKERAVRTVSHTPTAASNRQKRRKLQGWKFGVVGREKWCGSWNNR